METMASLTDGSAECDNDERHEKVYVYIARTIKQAAGTQWGFVLNSETNLVPCSYVEDSSPISSLPDGTI